MPDPSLLTPAELRVVSYLAEAWNEFVYLETIHQDDQREFREIIHAAQNLVMARPVKRQLNQKPDEHL